MNRFGPVLAEVMTGTYERAYGRSPGRAARLGSYERVMNGIFFFRLKMRQYVAQPRPSRAGATSCAPGASLWRTFRPPRDHRRRPNAARGVPPNFQTLPKRSHAWSHVVQRQLHRSHSVAERPEVTILAKSETGPQSGRLLTSVRLP
jgi:hypothetical protein